MFSVNPRCVSMSRSTTLVLDILFPAEEHRLLLARGLCWDLDPVRLRLEDRLMNVDGICAQARPDLSTKLLGSCDYCSSCNLSNKYILLATAKLMQSWLRTIVTASPSLLSSLPSLSHCPHIHCRRKPTHRH